MPAPVDRSLALALASPLVLLTGPALTTGWGVAPALLVLAAGAALAGWRGRSLATAGGWATVLAGLPRTSRVIVGAMFGLPLVIVTAVAARAIAGLCVAFPAVAIGVGVIVALAPAVGRVQGRGAPVAGLAAAVLAIAATSWAVKFEAEGPGARGFAHSGPILGIHPFQSTAVIVDGIGPFDVPINDYVEPDGSKGYGPEELAAALERTLHTIAEVHFADGPRRAREAFAGATVTAVTLPALQERLDRPAEAASEPRLLVQSGTTGRRSRVEFVCPGSPADPRPRGPDAVMERMCPDKYTSEASAGLGLTGRWTGYTEGRGQARVSLAPMIESLPAAGLWEERLWAWIVVLGVLIATRWRTWGRGLARTSAGLWVVGLAVLVVMSVRTWPMVQVGWFEAGPDWSTAWALAPWVAVLPVMLSVTLGAGAGWAVAGGVLAATLWAAGTLAAAVVLRPGSGGLEAWAAAVAERVTVVDLATAESAAALVLAAGLVRLLVLAIGPGAQRLAGATWPQARRTAWFGLVIAASAGLVVLSRKTGSGALLVIPALALTLAATSGLAFVAGRRRWLRGLDHAVAVALVVLAAREAWAARANEFMAAGLVIGLLLAAASLVLLRVRAVDPPGRSG